MRYLSITLFVSITFLLACSNDKSDIKKFSSQENLSVEIAKDVEILYSDSAEVKVKITSPTLKRYKDQGETYDEFPDGLLVEFLDKNKRVTSWMKASYAVRKETEKKIFVRGDKDEKYVILYNKNNDVLKTDELVWDEGQEEIYTSRPVKIYQPSVGDTSFGFGFRADEKFSKFEIQKFSALKNVDKIIKDLEEQ